jgi:hypothetical protein
MKRWRQKWRIKENGVGSEKTKRRRIQFPKEYNTIQKEEGCWGETDSIKDL